MNFTDETKQKVAALSDMDYVYKITSDFDYLDTIGHDSSGIVMEATVIYLEIKNLDFLLKTGKRLASRIYKMYYQALLDVTENTGGILCCYSPDSFVMIYPKSHHDINYAVDIALKTADLLSVTLSHEFEKHTHVNFSIGVDKGNILGTKCISDKRNEHISWFGTPIKKAIAISHQCTRPFFVGISGTVYEHLNEDMLTTTKHILGIKKHVEIWSRISYQFENIKKHLYQTNVHKSFSEEFD